MKFSLILPTLGRAKDLKKFLISLEAQNYPDVQLIIIDQNDDDRVKEIISQKDWSFELIHTKAPVGLSLSRNKGLELAVGDIIGFPDDDCEYPQNLLNTLRKFFRSHPEVHGITGKCQTLQGKDSAGRFTKDESYLDRYNVWTKGVSISIFLRKECLEKVGTFDESLGLGANTIFQSGEETDLLIRAIKLNQRILYRPDIYVFHDDPIQNFDKKSFKRAYLYGCGCGRVLKKHAYPFWFKLKFIIRPFGGTLISFFSLKVAKSKFYINSLRGRLIGLSKPISNQAS